MDLIVVISAWAAGLCVGSVAGALSLRWARTRPDYKQRWRSALEVIEQLDAENRDLLLGVNSSAERRRVERAADKILGRKSPPSLSSYWVPPKRYDSSRAREQELVNAFLARKKRQAS